MDFSSFFRRKLINRIALKLHHDTYLVRQQSDLNITEEYNEFLIKSIRTYKILHLQLISLIETYVSKTRTQSFLTKSKHDCIKRE
jgi:hypothetical protein